MNIKKRIAIKFLVVVLLCMECCDFRLVSGEVRCVEREREALVRFKEGVIDDGGILSSWGSEDSKKDCCKWKGVVCSNTNTNTTSAHVIALLLGYDFSGYPYTKPLRGKISDALLELHHLTNLDLSMNEFDDQFPQFMGSMKQLEHLNLHGCFFHGTLPPQLGNLTNLRTLDLGDISLRSVNLDWLSHLSLLNRLDLSLIDLSHTSWLQQILKLRSLQELRLAFSNIGATIQAGAPTANSSFTSLSILDLSYNEFVSSNLDWLFNTSTSLSKLYMRENELDGQIPHAFRRLVVLEDLDLSGNMLEGGISESLRNLSNLQALDLSNNDFSGDLEDYLFGNLSTKGNMSMESWRQKHFSALKKLNVGSNKFVGSMPQSLSQHSVLEEVDVSFNSLQGTISEAYFTKLHNLKVLALSFNSLSLQITQDWNPPFQLDVIRLAGCDMNPHFPQWVQTQRNVSFLDISYAHISDEVPRWLWSLSPVLLSLNISHNHISGTIPHLLSTSIKYLDVSSNNLSGPLPLLQQNMSTVQLSQNMFSGSLSNICSSLFVKMRILDLSNNHLDGEIPNCWEKMSKLVVYLNLGNNSFCGEVPRTLGNLSMLNSLNLHGNNLSGELPSTLNKCRQLMFIDVGGNKLTGNIPAWIGANKNLVYVILRCNRFYGSIPLEICSLTYIQVLDLSRNNISGEIPQCFNKFTSLSKKNTTVQGAAITFFPMLYEPLKVFEYAFVEWKGGEFEIRKILKHLKLIDLSSNRLVGSIPRSFSSMRALISLNLSRNMLTGPIVSDIGEMEMLEVLDLSRNQLSGHIPNSLAQLNFIAVLDLANNSLWGRIPLSTQLQSFNASAYAGNDGLCGLPLKLCPGDHPLITYQGKNIKKDGGIVSQEFGISMALGFTIGFLGVVAVEGIMGSRRSIFLLVVQYVD